MPQESLSAAAARGGAITIAAQIARVLIQVVQVSVLARLIAPESYGLLAMAIAFTGIAQILRDFGLSTAALRNAKLTGQQRSNLFWLNVASGGGLAAIVFCLSWPIAAFYGQSDLVLLIQWLSLAYLLSGITAQFRVAISQQLRFKALAICDVIPPIVALLAAVPVAIAGYPLAALIVLQLAMPAADLLCSVLLARWIPSLPSKTEGMRELVSFGLGFAGTQVLGYVTRNVDSVLIGRLWGPTTLGFYDRAFQLSVVPVNQINTPMTKVALPVLSRVVDEEARFERGLRSAQLIACYVTATVLCVAAGLAGPIVEVFLGTEWHQSAPLFAILALSSVFRAIQQIAIWLQVVKGTSRSLFMGNVIGQPIIILALCCGIPWGAIGIAVGSVFGYAAFWVFSMLWAGRNTGIATWPLLTRAFRIVALVGAPAGLAAYLVASFVPLPSIALLLVGVTAAAIAVCASWALSRQTRAEASILLSYLRSARGRG